MVNTENTRKSMGENELLDLIEDLVNLGLDDIIELRFHKNYHKDTLTKISNAGRRFKTIDGFRIQKFYNSDKLTNPPGNSESNVELILIKEGIKYIIIFRYSSRLITLRAYKLMGGPYLGYLMNHPDIKITDKDLVTIWESRDRTKSHPENIIWLLDKLGMDLTKGTYKID